MKTRLIRYFTCREMQRETWVLCHYLFRSWRYTELKFAVYQCKRRAFAREQGQWCPHTYSSLTSCEQRTTLHVNKQPQPRRFLFFFFFQSEFTKTLTSVVQKLVTVDDACCLQDSVGYRRSIELRYLELRWPQRMLILAKRSLRSR